MILGGFDLDGTLLESHSLMDRALEEKGYKLKYHSTYNFRFESGYSPPADFQWDLFFYRLFTERWQEIEAIEGAYDFLKSIYDGSEVIRVSTCRPDGALMHYATMKTLNNLFPDIDFNLSVVAEGSSKLRYLSGLDYYFDDRRATAKELSAAGMTVFMRNTTYNKISCLNPADKYVVPVDDGDRLSVLCGGDDNGLIVTYDRFEDLIGRYDF